MPWAEVSGGSGGIKYVAPRGGAAYTREVSNDQAAEVAAARRMLARARADLDQAIPGTPEIDGSYVLASPELRALLLRALNARIHLDNVVLSASRRSP